MKALVIVDMQNDFMPGGALGVPEADQIVPAINQLSSQFPLVVATQDWHPQDHCSFATSHPGKKPGDVVQIKEMEQILWPVHCVRATKGAELIDTLNKEAIASCFYKGTDRWIDSYSAFFDNARRKSTGLSDYLKTRNVSHIYIAGVATEYCVLYSSFDAVDIGYSVVVISDLCRPINLQPNDEKKAYEAMAAKGVMIQTSAEVLASLRSK
ncbi:MAG: bifunctional nicotinamidase/pyrazinamidase [Parachlamydiales bacterium]|nr:bifunctional nicotinamidase/pyrazinamidase [Candidatus Acheromyda pituitae]